MAEPTAPAPHLVLLFVLQLLLSGAAAEQPRQRQRTLAAWTTALQERNRRWETNELYPETANQPPRTGDNAEELVRRWAPVVWHAPGENFYPLGVEAFLKNVTPLEPNHFLLGTTDNIPVGPESEKWYLVTKEPVEKLLHNSTSFLHGQNPDTNSVPAYALISRCGSKRKRNNLNNALTTETSFHVTYWFFYPYNEGKDVCTVNFGFLGPLPIPQINNKCLGNTRKYGNHVGDWEHMSLYFDGKEQPDFMYVSTHDSGVYYKYNATIKQFVYDRQETRKGISQNPKFPRLVKIKNGRPVLFSAKGSHGLWTSSGNHRYARVPRLYDYCGYGSVWKTWENLEIVDPTIRVEPKILAYRGRWGNPKGFCHPIKKVGIDFCQLVDGPTGIPMKRPNFKC